MLYFLAVGVNAGEEVIGIEFDDAPPAQSLGPTGLASILVEGGLITHRPGVRRLPTPTGVLATGPAGDRAAARLPRPRGTLRAVRHGEPARGRDPIEVEQRESAQSTIATSYPTVICEPVRTMGEWHGRRPGI
ncbi:hypothetical protein [Streptomyces sp. NPDC056527]|uniref:hypothetical protein n=1 Tax=Streptomyces sp. NPDC056527 TaxID=3345853 RepID=UPI0036874F4A